MKYIITTKSNLTKKCKVELTLPELHRDKHINWIMHVDETDMLSSKYDIQNNARENAKRIPHTYETGDQVLLRIGTYNTRSFSTMVQSDSIKVQLLKLSIFVFCSLTNIHLESFMGASAICYAARDSENKVKNSISFLLFLKQFDAIAAKQFIVPLLADIIKCLLDFCVQLGNKKVICIIFWILFCLPAANGVMRCSVQV